MPTKQPASVKRSVFDDAGEAARRSNDFHDSGYTGVMLWFIRRTLLMWLVLTVICTVIVAMVRLRPVPNTLQVFGFDVCQGEPCFRGLKIGTRWDEAQRRFGGNGQMASLYIPLDEADSENSPWVMIHGSRNAITSIAVYGADRLNFSVGNLVAQYGNPCRVALEFDNALVGTTLYYPSFHVFLPRTGDSSARLTTLVWELELTMDASICAVPPDQGIGEWQGFIPADAYYERFQAAENF